MFFAFFLAIICSCQKEVFRGNPDKADAEGKVIVFRAESESCETKTSSDLNGYVLWSAGDGVSIFEGSSSNGHYQVTDESAGRTYADLVRVPDGGFIAGTELDANIAYYPYSPSNSVLKNGESYDVSVTLPQTQQYVEGSFANGCFPMMAVTADTEDKNLKFKNILGCLKIQLKGNAVIKSITVSNKSFPLCGPAKVNSSNAGLPKVTMQSGSVKMVALDCGSGVQLNEATATSFMIALPPATLNAGFTVDIEDINGNHLIKSTTKRQIISRSKVLVMPEFEVMQPVKEYVDLGLPSGTLWATHNMGAMRPEDRGNFYAWGETKTMGEVDMTNIRNYEFNQKKYPDSPYVKHAFQGLTYKFLKEGASNVDNNLVKYTWEDGNTAASWYQANMFYGDNKKELDPEDDAARANWGDGWRMPTRAELQELLDNCDITSIQSGDVLVCTFTSRNNGNSIIIPAGGYMSDTAVSGGYGSGYGVWSSSLYVKNGEKRAIYSSHAAYLRMMTSAQEVYNYKRYIGLPIRPVRNK